MSTTRRIIDYHKELRELAAEALLRTAAVAESVGSAVRHEGVERQRADLLREASQRLLGDEFTLTIVGEFSRGKSTLINALLGHEDLLPTAIEPATATITVLVHGDTPAATVTYADGTEVAEVPIDDLPRYVLGKDLDGRELQSKVTQKVARFTRSGKVNGLTAEDIQQDARDHAREARSRPQVTRVEVRYPSDFLADGIRIVDTPGLGSVNPAHGEATRQFIDESDAVLFLVNTDPVIGASECNFLTFLQDYVDHFLFVVTKIDRYSREEREKSIDYTRQIIAKHTGITNPRIFGVSARAALEGKLQGDSQQVNSSGFPEFLEGLDEFLVDGRGQRIMREYVGTARMHALDLRKGIELELQGIELSLDDLRLRIENSRKHLATARRTRGYIMEMLDNQVEQIVGNIVMGPTHTGRLRLTNTIREDVHAQLDRYDWSRLQQAAETIPIHVHEILGERMQGVLSHVAEELGRIRDRMAQQCFEVLQRLDEDLGLEFSEVNALTREQFGMQVDPNRFRSHLERVSTATIGSTLSVALANGFQFGGIGALIMGGGMLAHTPIAAAFHEQARDQIKDALEAPLKALVSSVFENVEQAATEGLSDYCMKLGEALDRTIAAIEESITRLETQMASTEFNTADRRKELEAELRDLDDIEEILVRARPAAV